jgi:uncharacterized protein YkwD
VVRRIGGYPDPDKEGNRMKSNLAVIAMLALSACGGSSGTAPVIQPVPPGVPDVPENTTFGGLLNNLRADHGVRSVAYDERLGVAAQTHANDMLVNDFTSHVGSDGSTFGQRIAATGYNLSTAAENVAQGQQSQSEVLQAWDESTTGHSENNLNPAFEDFALGFSGSGANKRWVLLLATEQP